MSQSGSQGPYYGGGGYVAGGSPFSQGGSPGGIKKSEASNSLRPVTIGQLWKATQAHTDAEWMLDDTEIGHVTVVAQVRDTQSHATNAIYTLEDGSGGIEARLWSGSNMDSDETDTGIGANTYARVTGTLKMFNSKRYIHANHIRPLSDSHELYFHILEAITVNVICERGAPPRPGQQVRGANVGTSASAYSNPTPAGQSDQFSMLPSIQRDIANFILAQGPTEDGVPVGDIARSVGNGNASVINDAIDKLMEGGYIYSTIDESHFSVSA